MFLYWSHLQQKLLHTKKPNHCVFVDETLLVNVVCGILSGVISSAIANPTDVLKVSPGCVVGHIPHLRTYCSECTGPLLLIILPLILKSLSLVGHVVCIFNPIT